MKSTYNKAKSRQQFPLAASKEFHRRGLRPTDNMVLGKNFLGHMMQNMSKYACPSKIYSNHCIRATCITLLDESGYEGIETYYDGFQTKFRIKVKKLRLKSLREKKPRNFPCFIRIHNAAGNSGSK